MALTEKQVLSEAARLVTAIISNLADKDLPYERNLQAVKDAAIVLKEAERIAKKMLDTHLKLKLH